MRDHIPVEQLREGQKVGIVGFRRFTDSATIRSLGERAPGFGGSFHYPHLTVALPSGEVTTISTVGLTFLSEEYERREWCPECRTRSNVTDDFTDSYYARDGEHEFRVTSLACGHDLIDGDRVVGPAPGAPYAGAGAVVARSARSRDLQAAHVAAARSQAAPSDEDPSW